MARGHAGYTGGIGRTLVLIPTGLSSATYSVTVPAFGGTPDIQVGFSISYQCINCKDFMQMGFQSDSGTQAHTTSPNLLPKPGGIYTSQEIAVSSLTLIPAINTFAGMVALPEGRLAPAGGISLEVVVANWYLSQSVEISIPHGSNKAEYEIGLLPVSDYWRVYVDAKNCEGCLDYFPGYYALSGSTPIFRNSSTLPGNVNLDHINLNPFTGYTVSGEISFPDSDTSPEGGHEFSVTVFSELSTSDLFYSEQLEEIVLSIPSGSSSIEYSIPVPPGYPLRTVYIQCLQTSYLCDRSYYSSTGSQFDHAQAEHIPGNRNNTNIDIEFIAYTTSDLDNDGTPDEIDNCPTVRGSQENLDGDTFGNVCDPDIDNDGVENEFDIDSYNPYSCLDADHDLCDDCAIGIDGFGTLGDFDVLNDGIDTDSDGMCNIGDDDDDGDQVQDSNDNCPLDFNETQLDICTFCFPVVATNGAITTVCM